MILTKRYLSEISERRDFSDSHLQQQVLNESRQIFISKNEYDLFLSHSYLDKHLVITLVDMFNKSGYSVYVDWIEDTQLDRNQVNKKTSEVLRQRMDQSKGLAYIATSNSSHSKWCPWELGYEDAKKDERCAILPVLETSPSTFRGQEYLGLYPYLEYAPSEYDFFVHDSDNHGYYAVLSRWLAGTNLSRH